MLVKLIEVRREMRGGTASLREIYVNSSHIVSISEDVVANETLVKEAKSLGLVEGIQFSKVVVSEGNTSRVLTVVGRPQDVYGTVKKRQVLRG